MCSVIPWEPRLLRDSRWTSGLTWNSVVINIEWVKLPPCQWLNFGHSAAKWPIKEVWTNFTFCFVFFIAAFERKANIHFSIDSISRTISLQDHNSTDQAIAMDRYQSDFRKLGISFLENKKLQWRLTKKIILFLSTILFTISSYLRIFKLATSPSLFPTTRPSLAQ